MRFGRLPESFGQAVAAQPWLLGYYPGLDRLGWLAARNNEVVAVGAGRLDLASTGAFAHLFTRELAQRKFDTLLVTGPPGTLTTQEDFAGHIARGGQVVDLVEIHANEYRRQRSGEWAQTPPPPMSALLSGHVEPALSFDELTRRYDVVPGPYALENAPVLTHAEKRAIDQLRPRSRFERAMFEIGSIGKPGAEVDPRAVARLAYLMTDPFIRVAALHQAVPNPDAVESLVSAHRVAHLEEGAELRGVAAMAVYTSAAVPNVADWIAEHGAEASLSRQVRQLIVKRAPSDVPRAMIMSPRPMRMLASQDEAWLSAQTSPLPASLIDLQQRLQQLQDPIAPGLDLPPEAMPPGPSGPQL